MEIVTWGIGGFQRYHNTTGGLRSDIMKIRNPREVAKGSENIQKKFKEYKNVPTKMGSDNGSENIQKNFKEYKNVLTKMRCEITSSQKYPE